MDPLSAYFLIENIIQIVKNWWWAPIPFLLYKRALVLWLWWRIDGFLSQQKMVLLEIKLPKEVFKPIRAMEVVLSSIHAAICQPPDFWEKWIDGRVQLSLGIEMVSIDGQPHFFIRTPSEYRDSVESSFYAQYPEIEIQEVNDYTKNVPQSIPNKEWDLFGSDYKLDKDDHFPIRTYPEFEKEIALEAVEEKKVDPVAGLLEAMAKIKKGEQLWVQFLLDPLTNVDSIKFLGRNSKGSLDKWVEKGEELRDKLARRDVSAKKFKPIIQEAVEILITGKPGEEKKEEKEIIPPEMKLTPGERDVLFGLEKKMAKPVFEATIRFIYLGKRDVFFKPNFRLVFSYFNQYSTNNLNALFPEGKTLTKIKKSVPFPLLNISLLRQRKHYLRCRKLFRNYTKRLSPFWPILGKGVYKMNVEEIASLFHFPSEKVTRSPGLPRIETKKKGMPSDLYFTE